MKTIVSESFQESIDPKSNISLTADFKFNFVNMRTALISFSIVACWCRRSTLDDQILFETRTERWRMRQYFRGALSSVAVAVSAPGFSAYSETVCMSSFLYLISAAAEDELSTVEMRRTRAFLITES